MFWLRLIYGLILVAAALNGVFNTLSVREHKWLFANVRQRLRNIEQPVLPRIRERLMRSDGSEESETCEQCERCVRLEAWARRLAEQYGVEGPPQPAGRESEP